MSYAERARLLGDDEEWFNIPTVVRRFLKQLYDEQDEHRNLIHSLVKEQRDTNALLQHAIQKQTDLEIDSARNLLVLKKDFAHSVDARDADNQRETHALDKKVRQIAERMVQLEGDSALLRGKVHEEVERRFDTACTEMNGRIRHIEENCNTRSVETQREFSNIDNKIIALQCLAEGVRTGNDEILRRQVEERCGGLKEDIAQQSVSLEEIRKEVYALKSAQERAAHDTARVEALCEHLKASGEDMRCRQEERLTSLLRTVEKAQTVYNLQKAAMEAQIVRQAKDCHQLMEEQSVKWKRLNRSVQVAQSNADEQRRKLDILVSQMTEITERAKVTDELLSAVQRANKRSVQTAEDLGEFEETINQMRASLEGQILKERTARERLMEEMESQRRAVTVVQEGLVLAETNANNSHNSLSTMVEAMRSELSQLTAPLHGVTQLRERTESHVRQLCGVINSLSLSVETLEKDVEEAKLHIRAPPCASTDVCAEPVLPSQPSCDPPASSLELLHVLESKLQDLRRESEDSRKWMEATTSRLERNEQAAAEALRSSERYLMTSSTHLASLLADVPWRDVTPALMELETMKRRMASLEACSSSPSFDEDSAAARILLGLAERRLEALMEDPKRRLTDLFRALSDQEQRVASLDQEVRAIRSRIPQNDLDVAELRGALSLAAERVSQTEAGLKRQCERISTDVEGLARHVALISAPLEAKRLSCADPLQTPEVVRLEAVEKAVMELPVLMEKRLEEVGKEEQRLRMEPGLPDGVADLQAAVDVLQKDVHTLLKKLPTHPPTSDGESPESGYIMASQLLAARCSVLEDEMRELRSDGKDTSQHLAGLSNAVKTLTNDFCDIKRAVASLLVDVEDVRKRCEKTCYNALIGPQMSVQPSQGTSSVPLTADVEALHAMMDQLATSVQTIRQAVDEHETELIALRQSASPPFLPDAVPVVEATSGSAVSSEIPRFDRELDTLLSKAVGELADTRERVEQLEQTYMALKDMTGDWRSTTEKQLMEMAHRTKDVADLIKVIHPHVEEMRSDLCSHAEALRGLSADRDNLQAQQEALRQLGYPKQELEERLGNVWQSVVSLVARKEDQEGVDQKLSGLHALLTEELTAQLKRLQGEWRNILANKISLSDLQKT